LLHPAEISSLDGRLGLAVLSACRSALGPGEGSDSLLTLTGAFLAAGSTAVVATLWDVDDTATRVFMSQFYDQLARGRAPADALRRAKLRFADDPRWARSSLWAAYILVGEAEPVVSSSNAPVGILVVSLALGIAILLLFAWRKIRSG
jgi:CHAT domain-containing protein